MHVAFNFHLICSILVWGAIVPATEEQRSEVMDRPFLENWYGYQEAVIQLRGDG